MKLLFVSSLYLLCAVLWAEESRVVFGVQVRWTAESRKVEKEISQELHLIQKSGKEFFDPDCVWRKRNSKKHCPNRYQKKTVRLDQLSAFYSKETLGAFNIWNRNTAPPTRDYGGLWQGYVLEGLRNRVKGDWAVDISGDIFVSNSRALKKALTISDPVFDAATYAKVRMDEGYMLASVSKKLGGKIRPLKELRKGAILKVVLFAEPTFSGTRLDAWSTAIVAGGEKVLEQLWQLKKFQGQWGYFYFQPDGTPQWKGVLYSPDKKLLKFNLLKKNASKI